MTLQNLKFEYEVCPDRDGNGNHICVKEKIIYPELFMEQYLTRKPHHES